MAEDARKYAIDDAVAGALIWHEQESGRQSKHRNVYAGPSRAPIFQHDQAWAVQFWQLPPQPSTNCTPRNPSAPSLQSGPRCARISARMLIRSSINIDRRAALSGCGPCQRTACAPIRKPLPALPEWVEGKHVEVRDRLVIAGLMRVEYHLNREALAAW